jgi:glycosyltransferase involved in cell wall biosynthesis
LLHKYGRQAASYRYRLEQYVPYLERAGHQCTVSPLLDDEYLEERLRGGKRSLSAAGKAAIRRLSVFAGIARYDLVVLCIEVFPYLPAVFERYLNLRGVPYVFDYDDPIFHYYDLSTSRAVRLLLGEKMKQVVRGASVVFGGSPYLVEYARTENADVELLPTVVDLAVYATTKPPVSGPRAADAPFAVGWIGSPSTTVYLQLIAPALRDFCARHPGARLVCVGTGRDFSLPGVPLELRQWSEATEIRDLLSFDVGLMPLTDDPWSRGKCGFKIVQYMACGLPTIASPVGVNADLVQEGLTGYLPRTTAEWSTALESLFQSPELASDFGAKAREQVEARYCLAVTAPRFVAGVERALLPARRRAPPLSGVLRT